MYLLYLLNKFYQYLITSDMKKLLTVLSIVILTSCGGSKENEARVIKEIVCGDSVEQHLYDQNGNEYTGKVPGKCDTIYEAE